VEPKAPPASPARAALPSAAAHRCARSVVLALSAGLLMAVGAPDGSLAVPEPDPAPTSPPLAPDPVPGTQPSAPATPAPTTRAAPPLVSEQPAPAPAAAARVQSPAPPEPSPRKPKATARAAAAAADVEPAAGRRRAKRRRLEAARQREQEARADAERGTLVRIGSFLPGAEPADDGQKRLLMLAAGALLALVMASGSFATLASRAMRGQLR
jgi:type IV secretory pathway VirB10-like protein